MKENKEERKFERPKGKKNTAQLNSDKYNLKKSFEQTKNPKAVRCFSTKLVINFVPKLKPRKSYCRPTHFQLNNDNNNNEKSFELDKISSCDDDDESKDSSSLMSSSSDIECDKEENINNNNKKKLKNKSNCSLNNHIKKTENIEQDLNKGDILSDIKKKKKSSDDEYKNLGYIKKKSMNMNMNETEGKDNGSYIKNLRKEMTKIKSKNNIIKYKETEEMINQNMKNDFDLEKINSLSDSDDEKENNKGNNSNKNPTLLTDKKFISNKHFSILDVLSFKNKKIEI